MDAPIISIDITKARARTDFAAGRPRDSHNMNWHAAALPVYLAEYDRLAAQARKVERRQQQA
jgi:hypothetical protein